MDASIIANSEVGTCTTGTPRMKVAATKPARSPTTPPPNATTVVSRPKPWASISSVSFSQLSRVFHSSPAGIEKTSVAPAPSDSRACSEYKGPTLESVISA
jgi:hypothetical protein